MDLSKEREEFPLTWIFILLSTAGVSPIWLFSVSLSITEMVPLISSCPSALFSLPIVVPVSSLMLLPGITSPSVSISTRGKCVHRIFSSWVQGSFASASTCCSYRFHSVPFPITTFPIPDARMHNRKTTIQALPPRILYFTFSPPASA